MFVLQIFRSTIKERSFDHGSCRNYNNFQRLSEKDQIRNTGHIKEKHSHYSHRKKNVYILSKECKKSHWNISFDGKDVMKFFTITEKRQNKTISDIKQLHFL